ncbi:MAG: hypothetical protein RI894_2069 [Bacteroidota bacterium]|jgi:hypothetical protein
MPIGFGNFRKWEWEKIRACGKLRNGCLLCRVPYLIGFNVAIILNYYLKACFRHAPSKTDKKERGFDGFIMNEQWFYF